MNTTKNKISIYLIFLLWIVLIASSLHAATVPAPKGWNEKVVNQARILTKGKTVVEIGPWLNINNMALDAWLQSMEKTVPAGATFVSSKGVIKETVPGAYSVTRKVKYGKKNGQSVLYACPGKPGVARLMKMEIKGLDLVNILVGASFGESVCKNEDKGDAVANADGLVSEEASTSKISDQEPSDSNEGESSNHRAQIIKTEVLDAVPVVKGLKEIRGEIVMGIQAGGMFGTKDRFIALFENGTYTSDLKNTFGYGVEVSKQKKANKWGHWKIKNNTLLLKGHADKTYDKTRGNWVARPASKDQKLSGCFGKLNSTSGADYTSGTTVGVARTWCFWENGRFTNSATAFGRSENATMRASNPKSSGRYVIDHYTARFVYDDGHEVIAAFCFANEKKNHIALNGKRFMGK